MTNAQLPIFLGLAAAMLSAPLHAADKANSGADWLKKPSSGDLMAVWPADALRRSLGGKAVISCTVTVQGTLRACQIVSESPQGAGFGGAAVTLSRQFLMRPAMKDGVPVETSVSIPINFPAPRPETGSYLPPKFDPPLKRDRIYNRIPWKRAPSQADMLAAFPAKARAEKVSGTATLDCRLNKTGGISGCDILREAPQGFGFGAAARSLKDRFSGPLVDSTGETLASARVTLTFSFPASALDGATQGIGRPEWTVLPTMADFTAVIPDAARKAEVYNARVVMECQVAAEGALEGCLAQSETPAGLGYADAAIRLSPTFRLSVWTDEGLPTIGGKVRVPLRFDLGAATQTGKSSTAPPPP
jgi:TonB family protein